MTYIKFISMAFQRTMAYRVEYYTGILNAFLYIFIFTSVWKALIPKGQILSGLTQGQMVAYAVFSTLIKVSFGRNESMLSDRVKSGEIAVDLMKPFNLPMMYFSDLVGVTLFQLIARAIPILIFSFFVFDISIPVSPELIFKFLPVYLAAFVLYFALAFFISCLSFYFVDIFPFWILYFALITLSSGAIIPLDFFPATFQVFLKNTPFPYLFYYPTMVILDKPLDVSWSILMIKYLVQIGLVMALAIVGFKVGVRKLTIAGG